MRIIHTTTSEIYIRTTEVYTINAGPPMVTSMLDSTPIEPIPFCTDCNVTLLQQDLDAVRSMLISTHDNDIDQPSPTILKQKSSQRKRKNRSLEEIERSKQQRKLKQSGYERAYRIRKRIKRNAIRAQWLEAEEELAKLIRSSQNTTMVLPGPFNITNPHHELSMEIAALTSEKHILQSMISANQSMMRCKLYFYSFREMRKPLSKLCNAFTLLPTKFTWN